jgi:hydroxymethylglutaryl-CoA lyase
VPKVRLRDVTPRDGLQGERELSPEDRARLALALADAGLHDVEFGAFVSPKAVPAMAGANEVFSIVSERADTTWWALVPNARGAQLALDAGVRHLTVTISASDGYSLKNVGVSATAALEGLRSIAAATEGSADAVDVVVSCCFGSPFDDVPDPTPVRHIVDATLTELPAAQVTLADTTGTATPRRVREVVDAVVAIDGFDRSRLGLHLHDTRGTALANALAALALGVERFDTATGGLGGSPFAPGAGGNLATEDLVLVLDDLGYATDVDLDAVVTIARELPDLIGHPVASRVSAAGPLVAFGRTP